MEDPAHHGGEEAAPDSTLMGRYSVVRTLGRGGMGTVYLAKDTSLKGALVAVKELRPSHRMDEASCKRFEDEIAILAKVRHENVVRIHDQGRHEGLPFYVMEYIDGVSLADLIKAAGSLLDQIPDSRLPTAAEYLAPLAAEGSELEPQLASGRLSEVDLQAPYFAAATRLVRQLLTAVRHVHSVDGTGIAHLDIKPANVMVTRAGRAVLMDFGISSRADSNRQARPLVPGTPGYIPPELYSEEFKRDLYAVGATLYEAVYLKRVTYDAGTTLRVPPAPAVPRALAHVIARAVSPNPSDRYPSALELEKALSKAEKRIGRWKRVLLSVLALAAAAVAGAAAVLLGFWHAIRSKKPTSKKQ